MPARNSFQPWRPDKRKPPAEVGAALRALAADAAADARVEGFTARVLEPHIRPKRTVKRQAGNTNSRRGLAIEGVYGGKGATAILKREGYYILRPAGSRGAADLWAARLPGTEGPHLRHVQVKSSETMTGGRSEVNAAVDRFLGLGPWALPPHGPFRVDAGATREVWLWLMGSGWVARIVIDHDDTIWNSGPTGANVRAAVERHLTWRRGQSPKPSSFAERLGL